MKCPRCDGRPERYDDGCVACDDTGERPTPPLLEECHVEASGAQRRAVGAVLARARRPGADGEAAMVASGLAATPREKRVGALVRLLGREDLAREVVEAFARAS